MTRGESNRMGSKNS